LILKLLGAVDPGLGRYGRFYSIGIEEATMKQTLVWLALALLFAMGVSLSIIADSFGPAATAEFGPAATAETTGPATLAEAPQPVVVANAKPAEPEVPVAMLDDVPPRSTIGSEALARWFVEPSTSPATRAAEAPAAPLPLAPATTATIAGHPGQDSKAGIRPPEGDARPTRKPKDSNAEMSGKRLKRTANARACGSSRFSDLLRRLNLASRCSTRRSAA
jgi:hypothetical protein